MKLSKKYNSIDNGPQGQMKNSDHYCQIKILKYLKIGENNFLNEKKLWGFSLVDLAWNALYYVYGKLCCATCIFYLPVLTLSCACVWDALRELVQDRFLNEIKLGFNRACVDFKANLLTLSLSLSLYLS